MSTSRHIGKICATATVLTLILTILFMNGPALGLASAVRSLGYENRLFGTSLVHRLDIVMDDWDGFLEACENEEYSACAVVIDGESCKNVGIRAKGNTSLSSVRALGSQRYSFKLEFDHYESGRTYHGLDKLSLNNLIQDNTMMKDYLVYRLMGDFGVDAPLCSYVYVTVNGQDWGLYLAVEGVEDSFLRRNYGTDGGALYKPDNMDFGGGRGNGRDFDFGDFDFGNLDTGETPRDSGFAAPDSEGIPQGSQMPQMSEGETTPGSFSGPPEGNIPSMPDNIGNDPETGTDPSREGREFPQAPGTAGEDFGGRFGGRGGMGSDDVKLKYIDDDPGSYANIFDNAKTEITDADKQRLISALKNLSEYTDLENTLDTDEVLRYFVVHNFVCNGDSYTGAMIHNYYLHEQDGRLSMIPWDYNLAFGTFQGGDASTSVNASIDSPVSGGSVDDRPMAGWIFSNAHYTEEYHTLFSEFIDQWFSSGQLARIIADTQTLLEPYVEKDPTKFCTAEEFDAGVQALEQFVTLRAEAVSRQLSGNTTPVDTTCLNISDMGSMGGAMGGDMARPSAWAPQVGMSENDSQQDTTPESDNRPTDGSRSAENFSFPVIKPEDSVPWESGTPRQTAGNSESSGVFLLGICAVVLLIGLLIVKRFKR